MPVLNNVFDVVVYRPCDKKEFYAQDVSLAVCVACLFELMLLRDETQVGALAIVVWTERVR